MPYLDVFGLEFENNISNVWNQHPKFVYLQNFVKKAKCQELGPKILLFVTYFWAEVWKYFCHIWNLCPRTCLVEKFGAKIKILKFWTKTTWFGYFWVVIWKTSCHIWNQRPRICLVANFGAKMKIHKFRTKNALFGYFWTKILKNYIHIWNQYSRISLILWMLTKTEGAKFWDQKCLTWVFLG